MRLSIEDHILNQDAKFKKLESELTNLRELQGSKAFLENEYQMCDLKIPLFIEDEYDNKIVTTPWYSMAKGVTIREDARKWGIVSAINYYFDLELKTGKQRVYCREENWSDLSMRVGTVRTSETKDSHGYGYVYENLKHGPTVEELKNYYTNKGVSKELVEEMANLVSDLRAKNPVRNTWVS